MALKATSSNGVKIYHVTAGKSTPQWIDDVLKKRVKGHNAKPTAVGRCEEEKSAARSVQEQE